MQVCEGDGKMREVESALYLSRLPGIGAAKFRQLMEENHSPSVALAFWKKKDSFGNSKQSQNKAATDELILRTLLQLENREIFARYFSQPGYPEGLVDLTEPPPIIFSTVEFVKRKCAAVVGARNFHESAPEIVQQAVMQLADAGYSIISGGARGIDTLAHNAALESGVPTVAIFGNGLDVAYPAENKALFTAIKEAGGALMSELLCGTKPHRGFFPTRNRLIAAMADIVVVIQAGEKSGSAITGRWARKLGRRLFVQTPMDPHESAWLGNSALIKLGATAFDRKMKI